MKAIGWTIAVLIVALIVSWYLLKFAIHVFIGGLVLLIIAGIVLWVSSMFRRGRSSG